MKKIKIPEFKAFATDQEAIMTLAHVEQALPQLLRDVPLDQWNSIKVLHDEPEVWRLWLQLGEVRLNLHRIAPASDPFFHFHPWPSVVKCIAGGYWHRTGANPQRKQFDPRITEVETLTQDIPSMLTRIVPGSIYVMSDPCVCHQVLVDRGSGWNSSLMLTSKSYFPDASGLLSRKSPKGKNPALDMGERLRVILPIASYYGLEYHEE